MRSFEEVTWGETDPEMTKIRERVCSVATDYWVTCYNKDAMVEIYGPKDRTFVPAAIRAKNLAEEKYLACIKAVKLVFGSDVDIEDWMDDVGSETALEHIPDEIGQILFGR